MRYPAKHPSRPVYPDWITVDGIVLAVYEKSLIYSVRVGYFRKKVRVPLSVVQGVPAQHDTDIHLKGWFAAKEGLDKPILPAQTVNKGR